jgi:hypothetical protein
MKLQAARWVMLFGGITTVGVILLGCTAPARGQLWERYLKGYHGPYRGRVIDGETKEPLVGAAVVAIWEREKVQLLHSSTVVHEAREVLTDTNGEFVLQAEDIERVAPRRTLRPFFVIFLPGYGSYPDYQMAPQGFRGGILLGAGVTVELPRLGTREQRLDVVRKLPPGSVPDEKMPNLIRLMNLERVSLGLGPVHVPRGN